MRQILVKNAKGQTFDMNREDAFLSNLKGFGISRKTTYDQQGYIWKNRENILSQKKPGGDMIFDGYEQYDEFLQIIQFTPLNLMYQPLDTMYYMDVNTFTIDKSEISHKDGFLTCKVTFEGITPWYLAKKITRKGSMGQGKKYPYTYPYTYTDYSSGEVKLENNSGIEAYGKLTMHGPLKNPTWRLVSGEKIILDGKILAEIGKGYMLVVNANPEKYEIAEYDSLQQKVRDLYEMSDFNTERFLTIPPGRASLKVNHAGISEIKFYVEVMEFVG